MELISYDFDKTLIFTPDKKEGEKIWENVTGEKWNYKGWWANEKSLDTDVFNFVANPYTLSKINKDLTDTNKKVFIATGRLKKLEKQVRNVLSIFDLNIDDVYCNTGGDTLVFKCNLFDELIEKYKPTSFKMYDDREVHFPDFEKWAQTKNIPVTIIDVIKKTEKTFNAK